MNKSCSIVIPILNEGKNILKLKNLILKYFKIKNLELIFIDDNSTDNSISILKKIKSKKIKFFIRKKKNDLTKSCFLGIQKSKYNNIIIMDGDLQHHPKYLQKMFDIYLKKNKDIVICSRSFEKRQNLNVLRFFTSKFLISMINLLLGHKVNDPMSGYFIFKKKIFTKYKKQFYGKGYKILFDFLYTCKDLKIYEIKINFYKRKFNKSKMNLSILIHLIISMILKFFYISK